MRPTNSVYLPRRDGSCVQKAQTLRTNRVGLKRRPEDRRIGYKGFCKFCVRVHAQIMTGDLARLPMVVVRVAAQVLQHPRFRLWQGVNRATQGRSDINLPVVLVEFRAAQARVSPC